MIAFPDWLAQYQIDDTVFAEAYEATKPQLRAWMKKTIAQVYGISAPDSPRKEWNVRTWPGGFETEVSVRPLDWTIMLIDQESVSPVRLLAALVPALASGVKNVLVAFVGSGEISEPVLTGFELAGQEDVVCIEQEKLSELLDFMSAASYAGAVLDLRGKAESLSDHPELRYWRARKISSICVCKDEESPDLDILAFAHPDVGFIEADEESYAETQADAVVVPAELAGEALLAFRIVLTFGQEGCWIWNDFGYRFFRQESVVLTNAE
ncbi:hypothetical protein [Maridesulfovibrio sp.]|uniref:hypothetical protein n=1 Tax=Maridesulfovibrio sp. TaxID=2795000 RepID=UPI002A188253|nr:hypothetical protein [Maridesulfovibrio sp.]